MLSRRQTLALLGGTALLPRARAARPAGYLVENALHMFAADQQRFPFSPSGPYKPKPNSLDDYVAFVREAKLSHTVLVQPEPYQDDHRYLEYCFTREPSPGYFKGTCLFDPVDPKTPARIDELIRRNPNRIVALRIHEVQPPNQPYTTSGAYRGRDLAAPEMKVTWRKIQSLGLAMQVQLIPCHAAAVSALAAGFPEVPVLIDHLGWHTRGTPAEYEDVLQLARLPRVYMKVTILGPESKAVVRRVYDAFGPDRLLWESYGSSMPEFDKFVAQVDDAFDFAPEAERAKIRGLNAMKVFRFPM
jgi:predicted TIM-barrel fold metal-dependent hydrolase